MKIFKIKIHYSLIFLLIISLFTGSLFKILFILLSILLHECSHFICLKLFKVDVKYLEVSIIGGILNINSNNLSLLKKLIVDISGVVANIFIIIIIKLLGIYSLNYLIIYNSMMILFNLIPIIPLDGYLILNDILETIYDEMYTFILIKRIDICCLIMLLFVLLILKIYGLFLIWLFLLYKYLKYNIDEKNIKKIYYLLKK